jgi:hypothetical protein
MPSGSKPLTGSGSGSIVNGLGQNLAGGCKSAVVVGGSAANKPDTFKYELVKQNPIAPNPKVKHNPKRFSLNKPGF